MSFPQTSKKKLVEARSTCRHHTSSHTNRPTVAQIDVHALLYNLLQVRKIASGNRILAVLKANAYGHGAVLIAKTLEDAGVDFLGVSLVEEGVELRQAGIGSDILVLGGAYSDYAQIVNQGLIPVVFSQEQIMYLQEAAQQLGRTARVHLKINSGMNRLGLLADELPAFLRTLEQAPRVLLEGMLTHLAKADSEDHSYTGLQIQRFREAEQALTASGHQVRWKHIANSAATLETKRIAQESGCNLVRPGLLLYGVQPATHLQGLCDLRPILSWKTSITQLRCLKPGEAISYGGTWTTARESVIATLPVGYADGYSRKLSNRGKVLVRGQRASIVGIVCMDMIMVDVTDVVGVAVHDEVVLLGQQADAQIGVEELAELCETIPYEIFCSLGARVPRVPVRPNETAL